MFAPEYWGEAERFARFYSETYVFKDFEMRAVSGVASHFSKAITLETLAHKLKDNLQIDRAQLEEKGYTPALNAREFSAVIEAAALELYSSIDCVAKVIFGVHRGKLRGLKRSTRNLFRKFQSVGDELAPQLVTAFEEANWYEDLRFLRDELTHLQTGSCTLDHKTGIINYMHTGIQKDGRALIIDDILGWLSNKRNAVNRFVGVVFHYLNGTLVAKRIPTPCGMVEGRILMRSVDPSQPLTFDNGTCMSHIWFEKPENPRCPFADECGAYTRTRE